MASYAGSSSYSFPAEVAGAAQDVDALQNRSRQPAPRIRARVRALLLGYYGVGNLGDEMMLVCLKDWLESQGFDLRVLSERPEQVAKSHGLPSVENCALLGQWGWRNSWFKGGALRVIRAIAQSDALIVGGGDLIRDDMGWRTFLYTMEKLIIAVLLKKKVYVVNAGIGQMSTRYGQAILQWVLARCHRIIVRDARSQEVCQQVGLSPEAALAPDIVLTLPQLLARRSRTTANIGAQRPYVAVCLRHNPHVFRHYEMTEARIRTFARALDELIERRGVDVVFLPLQANAPNGRGDHQLHEQVARAMVNANRIHMRPWTADLDEVCGWIRGAQFVVAMRLHAAVLAQSCGRPSVLMPYDRKIREFGKIMAIQNALEASTLDDQAAVGCALDRAWLDAQKPTAVDTLGSSVSSIWAGLGLEAA